MSSPHHTPLAAVQHIAGNGNAAMAGILHTMAETADSDWTDGWSTSDAVWPSLPAADAWYEAPSLAEADAAQPPLGNEAACRCRNG